MIKVIKENNKIMISGHANHNEYGKDIVCASVSSIIYTTLNAIKCLKDNTIEVKDNETMEITYVENDEITNKLINNMMDLLKDLSKDYPKNISVKES